jgi:hypothetical protein
LAGYYDEHKELLEYGWTVKQWRAQGGYANISTNTETQGKANRMKETLFLSPNCIVENNLFFGGI